MDTLKSLLNNWGDREPIAALWLVVVSALFFSIIFVRSHNNDEHFGIWVLHLLEALSKTVVLVGLMGMSYFLLTSNYAAFNNIYGSFRVNGSISNRAWQNERNNADGIAYFQQDLQVAQYIALETEEIIQSEDATAPPLYRNITTEQAIVQNSIVGFEGSVQIILDDSVHHPDVFHTYTLFADYKYDIVNPTDVETRARFKFPLSANTLLYQDINIEIDGEVVPYWYIDAGAIVWDKQIYPGDKQTVAIQFTTSGMDSFTFEVVESREITDFELEVQLNTIHC